MPTIPSSQLVPRQPIQSANPQDSTLTIASDATPLAPGLYVFSLVVVDDSGNRSTNVAEASVVILDSQAPTAVVRPPRQSIPFGTEFTLDGGGSTDVGGGRIITWEWTLLPRQ